MENPGEIMRRALERRRAARPTPALRPDRAEPAEPQQQAQPAEPRHRSSHASYTALMRSHDRMRTRHISKQS